MINDKRQFGKVAEEILTKGVFQLTSTGAFIQPPEPEYIFVVDNEGNYCIDNKGNYFIVVR